MQRLRDYWYTLCYNVCKHPKLFNRLVSIVWVLPIINFKQIVELEIKIISIMMKPMKYIAFAIAIVVGLGVVICEIYSIIKNNKL